MTIRRVAYVSSWAPRHCGVAVFGEEATEYLVRRGLQVSVVSHTDGRAQLGSAVQDVAPLIDQSDGDWPGRVAGHIVRTIQPDVVHINHEHGLYHIPGGPYTDQPELLRLLRLLRTWGVPTVVEPHSVHGRWTEGERAFLVDLLGTADVVLLKSEFLLWRMEFLLGYLPDNVMVVPHGVRPEWLDADRDRCREAAGLADELAGRPAVALVGWIESRKRLHLVVDQWETIQREVRARTGRDWALLITGRQRELDNPNETAYVNRLLNKSVNMPGQVVWHDMVPRGERYYQAMGSADVVVIPSADETQSGTLARVFACAKPFVTMAPLEGLTSQTVESEAGLLATNEQTLRRSLVRLMTEPALRQGLAHNARQYVRSVASWELVAEKYAHAYDLAVERQAARAAAEVAAARDARWDDTGRDEGDDETRSPAA